MNHTPILAYLDAGTGAALAAAVASGAVGARALASSTRRRIRARFTAAPSDTGPAPTAIAAVDRADDGQSDEPAA